ncbi:IS30 family transposase [Kocuria sp. SL71]|uniref:IS30 family transposase n=1 Tax=Kocuria sp. SL71 TaxID=2995151 RepID=UPI002272DE01|nr:IS30 family transposase [Kocuria sp. SL71]MCY1684030.1 IS30 family transposase [Kocuria sp. SL71]MCY1685125.1 IS30 family transposase [Kocuria sp. SL71]
MVLTLEQQDAVWERWRAGEPVRVIARTVRCTREAVRRLLAVTGGIRPAARSRAPLRLSLAEREEISRGLAAGDSARAIATRLRRSASSVSREIARNGGPAQYRAAAADRRAWENARRPKPCKLEVHDDLRIIVREKLMGDWSPQQIAAWLRENPVAARGVRISHETIYRTLYIGARLALPSSLKGHLRSGRGMRASRKARRTGQGRGQLRNMVSIHDRPEQIETRTEVGHWEGDLVMGRRPSAVATLVERTTRTVRLVKLDGIKGPDVHAALVRNLRGLPSSMLKSITWDRGREMSEHEQLARDLSINVYFCDPRSPWQRGSNENTNRLLRQYLPKHADLSRFVQTDLDKIAEKINTRPRRVLGWETSHERLLDALMT